MRFGIIGVGGYVAQKHLKAIKDLGHEVTVAIDPHDSVGILDRYFPQCEFFTEIERFDRHISRYDNVDMIVVCSPNYLHDAHIRLGLRLGKDVICEKPMVINPWNLDQLQEEEQKHGKRVYSILQLRHLESVQEAIIDSSSIFVLRDVHVDYITPRGKWYYQSWKGDTSKSGGIITNLGIHILDLMIYMFGKPENSWCEVSDTTANIDVRLHDAIVSCHLSTDGDSPKREMRIGAKTINLSPAIVDMHKISYEHILINGGFGIDDVRPSIELAYELRSKAHVVGTEQRISNGDDWGRCVHRPIH